ncbi:MAG TPA: proline dehydrogenase family protein [Longimicrobiales bacterium]|nr:proline dehydrogenase family protein [Longimicrobiales bacterium]
MALLRSGFLWASQNDWLAGRLPRYGFARRAVRRFMPGETFDDALAAARRLGARNVGTVLTLLGEEVRDPAAARAVATHYRDAAARIASSGVDAELSVKPTHLGISVDPSLVDGIVLELARAAETSGRKLWIDMEGSRWTDPTLALAGRARSRTAGVGVCVQANLRRTEADLEQLLPTGISVRLVKGAYLESSSIAYERKSDVDAAYLRLAARMLEHARKAAVSAEGVVVAPRYAFGTHDAAMIGLLREAGVGRVPSCEIQMLYGVRPAAQRELAEAGVPLRILISYGDAWFAWYMRRLAERPANVWFLMRSLVAR